MSSPGVEEVFTIESGSGLIDLTVISVTKDPVTGNVIPTIKKILEDTSFLIFSEGLEGDGRIGLIKIGPDHFHALRKDRSLIYKLSPNTYFFQPYDSVDLGENVSLLVTLKSSGSKNQAALIKQFDEILNFFATIVSEVPGSSPEVDAVKQLCGLDGSRLYPAIDMNEQIQSPLLTGAQPNANVTSTDWPRDTSCDEQNCGYINGSELSNPARAIATGIVTGAEYVAIGFNKGTEFAKNLIHQGGGHLISQENRHDRKEIDPQVITILRAVRIGAETASYVAEKAVEKIALGARKLGQCLVPHIEEHGTTLFSRITGKDRQSSKQHVQDILGVTASGLQGFGTIYSSLTSNAKQLAKAVGDETYLYVQKRYGDSAAEATQEAMYAAGHTASAVVTTTQLGPKTVAKNVVKTAAAEACRQHL